MNTTVTSLSDLPDETHAPVFSEHEPKVIRLLLDAGDQIDPHDHPGRDIVLYARSGELDVHISEDTHTLSADDLIRFSGTETIAIDAVTDATALVILAAHAE
ncbi:cupin domain-containing protein (plasmid) [Haloferax sp. S1W]|uniref:cupin domain-containing protein n=1 Tax=Haloferax sp. S1W TaxID=3377110 RepID=UPI0037CBF2D7